MIFLCMYHALILTMYYEWNVMIIHIYHRREVECPKLPKKKKKKLQNFNNKWWRQRLTSYDTSHPENDDANTQGQLTTMYCAIPLFLTIVHWFIDSSFILANGTRDFQHSIRSERRYRSTDDKGPVCRTAVQIWNTVGRVSWQKTRVCTCTSTEPVSFLAHGGSTIRILCVWDFNWAELQMKFLGAASESPRLWYVHTGCWLANGL